VVNPQDKGMPIPEFRKLLKRELDLLKMDHAFAGRYLNEGSPAVKRSARDPANGGS
jgi:hypothetical protein